MFRRHIDFIAVLFIAAVMIGFSKAPSLRIPDAVDTIRLQNAISSDPCPISREILSRLAYILNR